MYYLFDIYTYIIYIVVGVSKQEKKPGINTIIPLKTLIIIPNEE